MSHWSEIDENSIVARVVVGDNNDPNNDEGYKWIVDNLGGTWIKTSYNTQRGVHLLGGTPLRKNFGETGSYYDKDLDIFIPPKPYQSWVFNEEDSNWDPPVPMPADEKSYFWNEESVSWVEAPAPDNSI